MKALVLSGEEQFELAERELPVPGDDEVAVKVATAAICRTDAKMWRSGHCDLVMPRVLDHEICGPIDEAPDRWFAIWPGKACGIYDACRSGCENLCAEIQITVFHRDGGFAEPLACAAHAIKLCTIRRADLVLIYGAGTLGILLAIAAVNRGASVVMTDPDTEKLARSAPFRNRYEIEVDDD